MNTLYFANSQQQSFQIATHINSNNFCKRKGYTAYRTGCTVQIFDTPKPVADKLFKEAKRLFEGE